MYYLLGEFLGKLTFRYRVIKRAYVLVSIHPEKGSWFMFSLFWIIKTGILYRKELHKAYQVSRSLAFWLAHSIQLYSPQHWKKDWMDRTIHYKRARIMLCLFHLKGYYPWSNLSASVKLPLKINLVQQFSCDS